MYPRHFSVALTILSLATAAAAAVVYQGAEKPSRSDEDPPHSAGDGGPLLTGSAPLRTLPGPIVVPIMYDRDDGTEVRGFDWYRNGVLGWGYNLMGNAEGRSCDLGLRFHLDDVGVNQGDSFVYARLVIPGTGNGQVDRRVSLRLVGIDRDGVGVFHVTPPSQLPKTEARVDWRHTSNWPPVEHNPFDCYIMPLKRYSPDISSMVNEILQRDNWGEGPYGKTLAVVVEDDGSGRVNFLAAQDYYLPGGYMCDGAPPVAPLLELYPTVESTFVGSELLGRPSDHSVTVNAVSLLDLEVYFEYGPKLNDHGHWLATPILSYAAQAPIEVVLDQLEADAEYCYRMRYRRPGEFEFRTGLDHSFRTQRAPGGTFTFTVQADSHLQEFIRTDSTAAFQLYELALLNALGDGPDFHLDLGDTFHSEYYGGRNVVDYEDALGRHLDQRPYFGLLCHSAPLFVVLGNHEGEQGWRLDGTPDNLAVWATNARTLLYPNPIPDDFYTGSTGFEDFVGLRENYYAWQWGDALFVVLDPFWYTTTKPHQPGNGGSGDRWDWTLGAEQYEWLKQTLEQSEAHFKFVFSHQVTGGVNLYGRGGIEAASHQLGGQGSYEWGGENEDGSWGFEDRRPGWDQPIHQLMAEAGVTIFFHGHDHVFVKQELDGLVYQECPQPTDPAYGQGHYVDGQYTYGDKVNNSGYLRVTVSPWQVTVDYVRAYLPEDEDEGHLNGQVAYTYTILGDCNGNGIPDYQDIAYGTSQDYNQNHVPDECECLCGDIDRSGGPVDTADLGLFALCYGHAEPTGGCTAEMFECSDLDGSGAVNLKDLGLMALWYGQESMQTVPNCGP